MIQKHLITVPLISMFCSLLIGGIAAWSQGFLLIGQIYGLVLTVFSYLLIRDVLYFCLDVKEMEQEEKK